MSDKRTDIDLYALVDSNQFPGYADLLRQRGVLDGLDAADAERLAATIINAPVHIGLHGWADGIREPRDVALALQQKAANVGCGSDNQPWADRGAASRALGMAADVLAEPRT